MLKHNKRGPCKWFAGMFAAAGLLMAIPLAQPVYAAPDAGPTDTNAVQTNYAGFSAVSDIKVNNVSVKKYGYYSVEFHAEGKNITGTPMQSVTWQIDQTENLPANTYQWNGYTFTGWNTKKDGSGITYKDKQSVTHLGNSGDTVKLYAQWSANTYKVTYDLNAANLKDPSRETASVPKFESGSATVSKKTDEALGTLPTVSRKGYEFTGWYTAKTGGNPVSAKDLMPVGNTTYYAHWILDTFEIHYSANGHGNTNDQKKFPVSYTVEDDDIKVGYPDGITYGADHSSTLVYYFTGWTGSGIGTAQTEISIPRGSAGNKFYNAQWNQGGFTVTCEDWTVDYNGNLYQKLGQSARTIQALPGTTVNGSSWGSDTRESTYYNSCYYHGSSSAIITDRNVTVYRYFWVNANPGRYLESVDTNNKFVPFHGTVHRIYYDRNGNELYRDDVTGQFEIYDANQHPDGISYRVDESSLTTNDEGYTLKEIKLIGATNLDQTPDPMPGITNGGSATDNFADRYILVWNTNEKNTTTYVSWNPSTVCYWDDSKQKWMDDTMPNVDDIWDSITVSVNGVDRTYKTWSELSADLTAIPDGTVLRMKSVKTKKGWAPVRDLGGWYFPTSDHITNMFLSDFTATGANVHIDGIIACQDGYTVAFNGNGGIGSMNTVFMSNEDENARSLPKNTFTNDYATFLGWSTDPDAAEPEYKDGDQLPANLTGLSNTVTLYAVWGTKKNESSPAKKSSNVTVFDSMQ